jgi:hypothetical protein
MKRLCVLLLPFLMSGCMLELLTTTAIEGELAAKDAQASVQALNYAKESTAKTNAEYAIRTYQAEKGTYPPSLSALVPGYLPSLPVHSDGSPFGYDPATGKLLDHPAPPSAITPDDERHLKELEDAIYAYWQATGDYPPTLESLVPTYLTSVPQTNGGGSFVYNIQTGAVNHPSEVSRPGGAPAAVSAGGGAGPLGETTASIGIQNQLRNMNTSGASNAGSAGRRSIGAINDAHNRQQQQALDDLDQ